MGTEGVDPTVPASRDSKPVGGDLAEGTRIGRYQLVTRLGAGAMGVVWSAIDPQLERKVAIKVVHPALARAPDASDRLLREARAMAKLSHRAVVIVHDAGEVDGRLFVAMELVTGTTLGQMFRARSDDGIADWMRWLAMMIEAGHGLAAAHEKGILHRDFKPDNVLVDERGRVCVADFGLATLAQLDEAGKSQPMDVRTLDLTTTGALVGTPMYMSIEQLRGSAVDARADQFAFCVALHEALYGIKPFPVDNTGVDAIVALIDKIERSDLAPAPARAKVPERVRTAVLRGLAADPAQRWPDLASLLAELARAAGLSTHRDPMPVPARRARSWPWLVTGAAAVGLALALVLVLRRGPPAGALVPEPLFGVASHTNIAISPDGKRIVVSNDRIDVRELAGDRTWTVDVNEHADVVHAEERGDEIVFSTRLGNPAGVVTSRGTWRYRDNAPLHIESAPSGLWFGTTTRGEVYVQGKQLHVVGGDGAIRSRSTPKEIDVVAVSPDRRRVAYVLADRFDGRIAVWDVEADTTIESPTLTSPTAVDWLDDGALVYATGTHVEPRLWRRPLTATGFGPPEMLYRQAFGWFGMIRVHQEPDATQIYYTDMRPRAKTRMIDRDATVTAHDYDPARATIALGWKSNDEFYVWSRETGDVDIHDARRVIAKTKLNLDGEPVNATRAGDLSIISLRRETGREIVAYSIENGNRGPDGARLAPLWHSTAITAVRCARDVEVPCFALVATGREEQLVAIDPATGKLGTEILFTGQVEDLAVDEHGARIIVTDKYRGILTLDARGAVASTIAPGDTPWARSVAVCQTGELVVGGTAYRNVYQVGIVDAGGFHKLTETENDILSLARPSPDGKRITLLARTFSPQVFRLTIRR